MSESVNNSDGNSKSVALYIEDNFANTRLMQDIFSEFMDDYELICADDAETGIKICKDKLPGLVLMDINMKGMNGYQALEIIKNDPEIASTSVIAISADALPEQIEEGLAKGFVDYISKPFNVADLIETIKRHLG